MSYWTVCGTSNEHRLNTQTHTQNSIGIKALSALILSTLNLVRLTTQTVVANLTVHAADSKRLTGLLSQIKKKLWGNPSPIYIVRKKAHVALQHMLRPGIYAWNLKKTHTQQKQHKKGSSHNAAHIKSHLWMTLFSKPAGWCNACRCLLPCNGLWRTMSLCRSIHYHCDDK